MSHRLCEVINYDFCAGFTEGKAKDLCGQLVDFLTNSSSAKLTHISIGTLKANLPSAIGKVDDAILFEVTTHLAEGEHRLLFMRFQFIDEDNDVSIPISDAELHDALTKNEFFHPETGKSVDNFRSKIGVYFEPSELLKRVHAD